MTKVKICGIQRLEDALEAAAAGADFIGLVFVPERHRRLETDAAQAIVAGLRGSVDRAPQVVGLFADQPLADVNRTIKDCGLDFAQLCGTESLDYCEQVNAGVIKVVHVPEGTEGDLAVAQLAQRAWKFRDAGHLVTLDRLVEGVQGGTGHSFNWDLAAELARKGLSFLLAGGLSPANVARAIAEVGPWGVDVSSGVESNGHKDHRKIRDFIENARLGQGQVEERGNS